MTPARLALILGGLGLIPFAAFATGAWMASGIGLRIIFVEAGVLWGAIILSFMAGARWAFMQTGPITSPVRLMTAGLIPAVSLAAPFLDPGRGIALLVAGFIGLLVFELRPRARREAPDWYASLRIGLTSGAVFCLLVTALAAT